jgi:excinuclease ABC subunit A
VSLQPRKTGKAKYIELTDASRNNLKSLNLRIPLNQLVCISGVSGSGKTSLIRGVLKPILDEHFESSIKQGKAEDHYDEDTENENSTKSIKAKIKGLEQLDHAVMVDQSSLGKTPRSNAAVYTGAFEHIRELFASTDVAKQSALNASAFSFNSQVGQCERCKGMGYEKIEMQFLSDVFIQCADCDGRRYRDHILKIEISPENANEQEDTRKSIGDILDSSVDNAIEFLKLFEDNRHAAKATKKLHLLADAGLGYLKLGQPINTLSGGECQRLKLASHLTHFASSAKSRNQRTLFLFDEPTTGLHYYDVQILLNLFAKLVEAGHSVIVVEHNLDVIRCSDWIIDLGPESGANGGFLVVEGSPQQVENCAASHTGAALKRA